MRYKIKTDNYYKEKGSLYYTCVHCGVQHHSKHLMKDVHIPNCLEKPKKLVKESTKLKFIVTIESSIEEIVVQ